MRVSITKEIFEKYYDLEKLDDIPIYDWLRDAVPADASVIDIGAGEKVEAQRNIRDSFKRVCGVDMDEDVLGNPGLHEAKLLNEDLTIPYADAEFDAAVTDYVLEHVESPKLFLAEANRVLKPGGRLYFRTVNLWHPMTMVSLLIPRDLRTWLCHNLGHSSFVDNKTYPTYFRMNTRGRIQSLCKNSGFSIERLETRETHPIYFWKFAPMWYCGMAYERLVNRYGWLAPIRVQLYGCLRKFPKQNVGRDT